LDEFDKPDFEVSIKKPTPALKKKRDGETISGAYDSQFSKKF